MESPLLYAISLFLMDTPWYAVACAPYMQRLRVRKGVLALIILGGGLLRAGVGYLMAAYLPDWRAWRSLHLLLHTLLMLAVYLLIFRVKPAKLIYTLLLLQTISTTINFVAYLVDAPFFPAGTAIGVATLWQYTLTIIIGNALAIPFVWRFFTTRLRQIFEDLSVRSIWLLCATPALFFALHQFFLSFIEGSGISQVQTVALVVVILVTGLVIVYTGLRSVMDNAERVRAEEAAKSRLALQAQNYENLTQSIEAARAARHDLRHHINAIRDYAMRDDKEGLLHYLDDYAACLPADDMHDWCGNQTVNALLKHYLAKAAAAGVRLDIKLDLPACAGITASDLCVVFGNIFENAAAAATTVGEGAFIRARCECGDADVVLTVENSIAAAASHGEGLGLRNVAATAKKYGGSALFEAKKGVYYSRVLLHKPVREADKA